MVATTPPVALVARRPERTLVIARLVVVALVKIAPVAFRNVEVADVELRRVAKRLVDVAFVEVEKLEKRLNSVEDALMRPPENVSIVVVAFDGKR